MIGGLGASLAVEEISRMIDAGMGLPENMFFYALDRQGRTSWHRMSSLLFAYPSDMGSKSLATTVNQMLAEPEGAVTYDFYGERTVLFRKYPLTGWVYAVGLASGATGRPVAELPPILGDLGNEVAKELFSMDRDLAKAAQSFAAGRLTQKEQRKELADLCRLHPAVVDCSFVDRSGRTRPCCRATGWNRAMREPLRVS